MRAQAQYHAPLAAMRPSEVKPPAWGARRSAKVHAPCPCLPRAHLDVPFTGERGGKRGARGRSTLIVPCGR